MDHAVESLIIELASSISTVEYEVQLTEDQKALGIPPPLVYLAGLVICSRKSSASIDLIPPFPADLQERFLELQKLYHNVNGVKTHADAIKGNENTHHETFQLSPRIIPIPDQMVLIQKDLAAKLEKLERQADAMAQELMIDQDEKDKKDHHLHVEKNSNSSRFRSSKTHKKMIVSKQGDKVDNQSQKAPAIEQHPETQFVSEETLQDLMNMQIRTEGLEETCQDGGSWMTITKKGNKFDSRSRNDAREKDDNVGVGDGLTSNNSNTAVAAGRHFNKLELEIIPDAILPISIASIPSGDDVLIPPPNYLDRARLQERIRHLDMKLVKKNEKLMEERKSHCKSMRERKEGFENQIQALQMRLYISETRLKNYQDALEQHVRTVAENVSGT